MPELKVTEAHLERDAYLYVRQSTARQVLENTESTQRQYALRDRALAQGWPQERIHVIDCDLGKSAAPAMRRDGFQQLVSEVALGKAGMVLGLEVSRLARNSVDWHRLIELCAQAGTLILDEDGLYDPANFNDRLLLGLKGEMSQAELHILKARMRGGVLNKARRGELEMGPPVGLIYRPDGKLVLDPDQEVQAALRFVFETFARTRSAMQTLRWFRDEGIRFPRRPRAGPHKGELLWGRLDHSRILQMLHNPRYAGAFVYGRVRTGRTPDGKYHAVKVPPAKWPYVIRDAHPGYISWDQFEANQTRLAENALGYGTERKFGPAREGPALLQGRALCGVCGARMGVHYVTEHGASVPTYVCQDAAVRSGARVCQRVPGKVVDPAIGDLLLELVQPLTLDVALAVQQEVDTRWAETDALRRQQVERARYDAALARRRYMQVDPDNRLVADALEAEWNATLRAHQAAQEEYERRRQHQRQVADEETRQKILSLAQDFPRLWNDPSLEPRERKRMVRLLIEDATLVKTDVITVHVRLRGGATRTLVLPRPVPIAHIRKVKPTVVAEIDRLLEDYGDREIAEILTQQGLRTWQDRPFTLKKVAWTRGVYHLVSHYGRLRAKGCVTAEEMSRTLGVSMTTVHEWGRKGLLRKHPYRADQRGLFEPLANLTIAKGRGGRRAQRPSFVAAESGHGAV
ncbi:MAG TPA: recombinase family protein [Streptosporangiaceae bacterium]